VRVREKPCLIKTIRQRVLPPKKERPDMPKIPFFSKHPDTATDPVCKMDVDVSNPNGGMHEHEGDTYYFCSPGCRVAFSKEPAKYLDPNFEGMHM